jgi:SAM-dependent methyltransferase
MCALSQSVAYDSRMTANNHREQLDLPPSRWVSRFAYLVARGGRVLDVACGAGRHACFFAGLGHPVDAVDRDVSSFVEVPAMVCVTQADIEVGPWPYHGRVFSGVVVTNYLYRPLLATLLASVAPGGALIYETFAAGNERFGRPSRADFLLHRGELLDCVRGQLQVVAYEDIYVDVPKPAMVQRIAAVRPKA